MFKHIRGFKRIARSPLLGVPAVPCTSKVSHLCNGMFVPTFYNQKICLHCLHYLNVNYTHPIKPKTPRDVIIDNIIITWVDDIKWREVKDIITRNEKDYKDGKLCPLDINESYKIDRQDGEISVVLLL